MKAICRLGSYCVVNQIGENEKMNKKMGLVINEKFINVTIQSNLNLISIFTPSLIPVCVCVCYSPHFAFLEIGFYSVFCR